MSAHVFLLFKNELYFENYLLAEDDMMEILWCQLEKNLQLVKNERVLAVTLAIKK